MILKKKFHKNILTKGIFCAKIGIVKVFFTLIGNNFHNFTKTSLKTVEK